MRTLTALGAVLAGALSALLPSAGAPAPTEIVVYSARSHYNQEPAFDAFTKKTGTQVKIFGGNAPELFERLRAEGDRTLADVLITVDAGYLWNAARAGLLARGDSPEL
ncbi:MAG: iron ABC transporter substrate-binding protein, partial [candidate division NC10 bacterium]